MDDLGNYDERLLFITGALSYFERERYKISSLIARHDFILAQLSLFDILNTWNIFFTLFIHKGFKFHAKNSVNHGKCDHFIISQNHVSFPHHVRIHSHRRWLYWISLVAKKNRSSFFASLSITCNKYEYHLIYINLISHCLIIMGGLHVI